MGLSPFRQSPIVSALVSVLTPAPLVSPRLSPDGRLQGIAPWGVFAPKGRPSWSWNPVRGGPVLSGPHAMDWIAVGTTAGVFQFEPQQARPLPEPAPLWEEQPLEPRQGPSEALPQPAGPEKALGSWGHRDHRPHLAPHTKEIKPLESLDV